MVNYQHAQGVLQHLILLQQQEVVGKNIAFKNVYV